MPATLTTNERRRSAFAKALTAAMDARNMTQERLGARLGNLRQSTISAWTSGHALPPDIDTVFRLEKVLKLSPGTLSRQLGFMPTAPTDGDPDVRQAILADVSLDAGERAAMLNVYDTLIEASKSRHPTAHRRRQSRVA